MKAGKRRPDPLPKLIESHAEAVESLTNPTHQVVLIGKSMGGRVGCHLANADGPASHRIKGLICLGYPLRSSGKRAALRDQVLLRLNLPILFVQGTRDRLCPLDELEGVRKKMVAENKLFVVETGDHSLLCKKRYLKAEKRTQDDIENDIAAAISDFVGEHIAAR